MKWLGLQGIDNVLAGSVRRKAGQLCGTGKVNKQIWISEEGSKTEKLLPQQQTVSENKYVT
jgi:hypothetical protein